MAIPPEHILVGTDFSPASQLAVDRACDLARESSSRITLQHVVASSFWDDVIDRTASAAGVELVSPAAAEAEARAALVRRADEIAAVLGRPCGVEVGTGRAPHAMAHAARTLAADLVVIGAHGAHPVRSLLVGTTAQKLLQLSPCPVLIVRRPVAGPYRTVLCPTDFSPASRGALRAAVALLPQATLHVAHAFELPYDGLARHARVDETTLRPYRRDAQDRLHARLVEFAGEAGVAATRRVLRVDHGYPAACIDRWIQRIEVDLVVIAARGRSELEKSLLGSVSLHTALTAPCDVLLLRSDGTD